MAKLVAGVGTSHVPAIGAAIDLGKTEEPYWRPLFKGYEPARKWLAEQIGKVGPEVLMVTGDMPYAGAREEDWQVYRDETRSWAAKHMLVLPTIGNHEVRGGVEKGIANFLQNYPGLKGHRYYSVLVGSVEGISLVTLSPAFRAEVASVACVAPLAMVPALLH